MTKRNKILVILGPTAVGKTDLGIRLAKKFDGVLIAADSRQVYKGLDIGTGKYSPNDTLKKFSGRWLLNDVWIHGYDLIEPERQFTAADFAKFFWKITPKIWVEKNLPILVGGTGFYIKAALVGFETLGIPANHKLRKMLEKLTSEELLQKLFQVDPRKAQKLSPSDKLNPRRLIRAIEVSQFLKSHPNFVLVYPYILNERMDVLKIGLNCPREILYKRIDKRVDLRLKIGMVGEVRNLLKNKVAPNWLEALGLEYRWITQYLLGKEDFENMTKRLKGDIHNFARRQLTWFRREKDIIWFDITTKNYQSRIENLVRKWYK